MRVREAVGALRRVRRYGAAMGRAVVAHGRRRDHSLASLPRRVAEQWCLLLTNSITVEDYYFYGLDRPRLPWARKREFVGEMERRRWQERLNSGHYRFFTKDKVVTKRFLAHAGIPVPRLLGLTGFAGRAETGEPLRTPAELGAWLASAGVEQAVFKPVLGARGHGVLILGARTGRALEWERVPDRRVTLDGLLAHLEEHRDEGSFLIEERLRPHPDLTVFSAEVLHTARILTVLDGEVQVIAAALRIGMGEAPVDNFAQGNIAAPIDLDTGRLGPAVFKREGSARHRAHPATGVEVAGRPVPDWERARALVDAAARLVPFNPVQGWDVGFTPAGPVIVEANGRWGPPVSQFAPDLGLLGTPLRAYLERRGLARLLGLGLKAAPPARARPDTARLGRSADTTE